MLDNGCHVFIGEQVVLEDSLARNAGESLKKCADPPGAVFPSRAVDNRRTIVPAGDKFDNSADFPRMLESYPVVEFEHESLEIKISETTGK